MKRINSRWPLALAIGAGTLLSFTLVQDKKGYDKAKMNPEASACEDFYEYAIGGWQKANPIPSTESRWGVFNVLDEENRAKLQTILEDIRTSKSTYAKGSDEQLLGDFYLSALDSTTRNTLGVKAIAPYLQAIQDANTKEKLWNLIASWRPKGIGGAFGLYVGSDAKNSDMNTLYLGQGGLQLPDKDYYTKDDSASNAIRMSYMEHVQKMMELAGIDKANAKALFVLNLETDIAKISMSRTERRDPDKTYNKFTKANFLVDFGDLDWNSYLNLSGTPEFKEIIVSQPDFIRGLAKLWKEQDIQAWQNYFTWQVIHEHAGVLSDDFQNENFRFFSTVLRGTETRKPLSERAVQMVNGSLGETLGKIFVQKHFNEASKKQVAMMVEELREAFRMRIVKLDWMSDTTKEKALEKLNSFKYKIGYPDKWKDYSMLDIRANDLIGNSHRISELSYKRMMEKLGQPVDKEEWGMTPQTVNAYYNPLKNEIVFPAGILQAPFFDPNADDALNYGGIGAVIGHEFSHGFDDKGSKYDAAGNLNNWWTEADKERFKGRTQKIVEQFNRFEVLPGVFINGELTQGENIADLAGLTMAYHALVLHYGDKAPQGKGKDGFTWEQRFFMGWAQVWAQNITEKELRRRIITDPHSPGRYRVLGPLSNLEEYWKAFGCTDKHAMHAKPEHRVIIW